MKDQFRRKKIMWTFVTIALVAIMVALLVYLFNTLPDASGLGKGKCDEKDYEITDKLASKKN